MRSSLAELFGMGTAEGRINAKPLTGTMRLTGRDFPGGEVFQGLIYKLLSNLRLIEPSFFCLVQSSPFALF